MCTLYMICGSVTLIYSFLAPLVVKPQVGLVSLLICIAHFDPFPHMCASCGPHFRF
jgi:hypothetical protein